MPMVMRIDSMDDFLPGGLTTDDIIRFCNMAKAAGVDILSISRGNKLVPVAMNYEVPSIDIPRGFNIDNAAKIKAATGIDMYDMYPVSWTPSKEGTYHTYALRL